MNSYHNAIRDWYQTHGRQDLPWRNTDNPYHIYISEVMLQQTQVKTVLERYYFQFLERFPSLQALADAPLEDVLKAWEGLGYYSRARNLHKAAQTTAPELPYSIDALMALSGIGKNTAHAIATFAYHQPVPVMEANVKRVLHRYHAQETMSEKALWDAAYALVDQDDPFTYNQAMMDIGSTLCTPKAPKCLLCPIAPSCAGKDMPEAYPAPKQKKAVPVRSRIIIVFESDGYYYAAPRESRFLGGLYGFPEYEHGVALHFNGAEYHLDMMKPLGEIRQQYSHFTLEAAVYHLPMQQEGDNWHTLGSLHALPTSRADQKVLKLLS